MFVKVCGITRLSDAVHAAERGATALGFVFWPHSPRFLTPERAAEIIHSLPSTMATVGVFVNETADGIRDIVARSGINAVQLHGDEGPEYAEGFTWPVLRSVTIDDAGERCGAWPVGTMFVVDAADPVRRGGTGSRIDWGAAAEVARRHRVILAGGLTPENVSEAIATVRPYGVDVSSGVEASPGVKDSDKVTRFVANAHRALRGMTR
jgi:phosphoribosylanthranilate isomerase